MPKPLSISEAKQKSIRKIIKLTVIVCVLDDGGGHFGCFDLQKVNCVGCQ